MDFVFLFTFILLFVFSLWRYSLKKKDFDAGSVLISLYLIYAVFSLLLYFGYNSVENIIYQNFSIQLSPLLFLFICLIISFSPIFSYSSKRYKRIQPPYFNLDIFAWFFILCYFLQIGNIVSNLSHGLYSVLFVDDGTAELYDQMIDNTAKGGIGISNIFSIFGNMFYGFGILMFYYYLSLSSKKKKWIIWGLGISVLIGILTYAAAGQRGGMIKRTILFFGTYFMVKDYLRKETKRRIRIVGLVFLSFLFIVFLSMSQSRFGQRDGGVEASINRYAGQAILNFDRYAFDNNGIRYGDRIFPLFKRALQFDNVPRNFVERRAKYPHLYINDEVFVTYVGDFCFDFGPIIAFLIILLFTIWVHSRTKCSISEYPFHKLILLHFVFSICIQGGSLFPYADTANLAMLTYIVLYFFFRITKSTFINSKI